MTNNLTAFLKESAPLPENIKKAVSTRFLDEDGKPIEWEIRCISYGEDEEIRQGCTKKGSLKNGKSTAESELDKLEYMRRLLIKCVVFPNLNSAELQNSYGVMGADELIRDMLTPGEFMTLMSYVYEQNSFIPSFEEEIKEAEELIEGDDYEAKLAYYCLHHFNILPSQLVTLPRRERAFILASIKRKKEFDEKENG